MNSYQALKDDDETREIWFRMNIWCQGIQTWNFFGHREARLCEYRCIACKTPRLFADSNNVEIILDHIQNPQHEVNYLLWKLEGAPKNGN